MGRDVFDQGHVDNVHVISVLASMTRRGYNEANG